MCYTFLAPCKSKCSTPFPKSCSMLALVWLPQKTKDTDMCNTFLAPCKSKCSTPFPKSCSMLALVWMPQKTKDTDMRNTFLALCKSERSTLPQIKVYTCPCLGATENKGHRH